MLELMPLFYFLTFAKVPVSVSKKFGLKKVSVLVSKTFGLEKKTRYWSQKHLVSKKSLGIGLENIWSWKKVSVSKILVSKKSLGIGLDETFWSRHSVQITWSKIWFCFPLKASQGFNFESKPLGLDIPWFSSATWTQPKPKRLVISSTLLGHH